MSVFSGPNLVDNGLVLLFDFGNNRTYSGSGTTVNSIVPNIAATGTLVASPTFSTDKFGAFTFDGTNNYISTNRSLSSLSIGDTYSFETVTKRSSGAGGKIIWGWQGFNGGILNGGAYQFIASDWYSTGPGTWGVATATSTTAAQLDVWYHVVMTFNAQGFMRIYVNGVNDGSTSVSGFTASSGNVWYTRTASIVFGGGPSSLYRYFGTIGLGRMYNRELTANEIKTNFDVLRDRYGI